MKVGIVSMQRICNYGSYLQAFGLKKMIGSLGHEVVFIDYKAGRPLMRSFGDRTAYVLSSLRKRALRLAAASETLSALLPKDHRSSARSYRNYKNIYWSQLGLTPRMVYHTKVDTLVIGSDEVFNCLQSNPEVGFSTELFGDKANAKRIITYAASFGSVTCGELAAAGADRKIRGLVSRFDAVSVRDRNSLDVMRRLLPDRQINVNLDPALLTLHRTGKTRSTGISGYVLVYAYRGRLTEAEQAAIKAFARAEGRKTVCIGGYHSFGDMYIQPSPFRIMDWFENAGYVITDTFHGTVFSVISHTRFGVLVREGHGGNREKLTDLLERLGASSRIVSSPEKLPSVVKSGFDFARTDEIIKRERLKAMEYLRNNL